MVICTDGLANVGVGTLEDEADIPAARAFYTSLADHALSKGVSVSIVTIDGTEADLDSIECLYVDLTFVFCFWSLSTVGCDTLLWLM